MATVTIGSNSYQTYRTLAQTSAYLEADASADAWRAAEADPQSRAIVTATRTLDRMPWRGSKTESDQTKAWPRSGIDGVEDDETPQAILDAESELANFITNGTDVLNGTTEQNVKRQAAGSVSIEYFRSFTDPSRLPLAVQELLKPYLAGSSSADGAYSFGTDSCSDFERGYEPGPQFL